MRVIVVVFVAACVYEPEFKIGLPCSETQQCPAGQQCNAITNTCGGTAGVDATASTVDCTGDFGEMRLVMPGEMAVPIGAAALTGDELELFYLRARAIHASVRTSRTEPFGFGAPVDELNAYCTDPLVPRSIDISYDGLRAYVMCEEPTGGPFALHLAAREDRAASFADMGTIGATGEHPAIDGPELTLFSMLASGDIGVATRSSTTEAFSPGQPLPELAGVRITSAAISYDNLTLYAGDGMTIAVYTRVAPDAPFAASAPLASPFVIGGPEISSSCRALYFIGVESGLYQLYVVER